MKLNLIPEPQNLLVTDAALFHVSDGRELYLSVPQEDQDSRLIERAREWFAQVEAADPVGDSAYLLFTKACSNSHLPNNKPASHSQKQDAYELFLDKNGFMVSSRTAAGLFYGMQTLRQLLEHQELCGLYIEDWADLTLRADYLDLRTIFPPLERLLYFIKELSYYKINTLVVEYEDKIPFSKMPFLRHPTACFTEEEFSLLLHTAKAYFIDIIPLQQSFGHLEYALKFPQYLYLRETPDHPGEMCPLREGAAALSCALLEDTASLHPDSRYLHMGCDEVWSLGQSLECRESGKSRERIFIEFVNQLIDKICTLGKIPLIWHDMFAHATDEELALLDKRVIVAVWLYNGSDMPATAGELMKKLDWEGISYLGCSSVRCWDNRPEQNYPDIDNRLLNLDLWSRLAQEKPDQIHGFIHTNWGSSFSFGRPYGLFETSRYPLLYGAHRSWNLHADTADFLYRFLFLYHGIDPSSEEARGYGNRDYYLLTPTLLEKAVKNKETAKLISLMLELERSFPVQQTMFRLELYPDSEVEYTCQRERSLEAFKKLDEAEKKLREFIPELLNPDMAELFIMSRLYLYHMARERLEQLLWKEEGRSL